MPETHDDIQLSTDEIVALIQKRIESEPAFRAILYKMLSLCKNPKKLMEVESAVLAYPEMKVPLQKPQIFLTWLIECQAILAAHPTSNDETQYQTTLEGLIALEQEQSDDKIEALFTKEPEYKSVYLDILSLCKNPKSRIDIEKHLMGNPLLESPKIYPSYFIDSLETAGGLEWNSHWVTTSTAISKLV